MSFEQDIAEELSKIEVHQIFKCKCGNREVSYVQKGKHIGVYCINCGKWICWAKQTPEVLKNVKKINKELF